MHMHMCIVKWTLHMCMQSKQYGHQMVCMFDQVLDQTKEKLLAKS